MRTLRLSALLALALAVGTAGCFGASDDTPPPPTGNNTGGGNTGGSGGGSGGSGGGSGGSGGGSGGANFTAYNGTDSVPGGPQAAKTINIDVRAGASSLAVTFARAGTVGTSALGGSAYQQFAATLTDPAGNATQSSSIESGFSQSNPATGAWVLTVSYASPPQADLAVTWDVS